ncbi:Clp protease N-terminal domain-containing protein [Allonocardiopsis opalescens]|uniref:ATP-dependent Clp protease ATP-binding subunit ClpC n=1 Tax=Allonocardiopsis opalescens TaxID=1144618 RepID=A0A2T0Q2K5_9ACTN|nr:Clp protease N-terminal domain-containing protein [Allonocardiopsis opalescens]PRX98024.1 ATP-dependent Clp protease ATP-binding subunit ClpC [Allonocardiopsis opalescens]
MPKINVYLPDELADAVKDAGVPVSAICQRALEQAVRRITAIRQTALGELDADDLTERLPLFTGRARAVVKMGIDRARADGAPNVSTGHLLGAMVAEGTNLALHVLRAVDIDPAQVQRDLERATGAEEGGGAEASFHFSGPAAGALELTVAEATALGHNYIGCEHLLLGLVTEPEGTAGQVLRALGAEPRLTRRAVSAALAGYVHLRAQAATTDPAQALAATVRQQLEPLVARVERLEQRLGAGSDRE